MKALSIIVPCYNASGHMRRCIDTLLSCGDALEVIIVNDGSTDDTAVIAEEYRQKQSQIVKVINQANRGHGGAINAGLKESTGTYVKVVDSDDWVSEEALHKIITTIKGFEPNSLPDVIVSNYIYEKSGKRKKAGISYETVFPEGRLCTWDEIGNFRIGQYMLMHALTYRLDLLSKSGLHLPEQTFYVDNLYAYVPLAYAKTLYYINVNFYHYFIGREGQSIQEKTMLKRIDQQLAVNRLMVEAVNLSMVHCNSQHRYLTHYLEIVTAVSSTLLLKEGSHTSKKKKDELWQYIKQTEPEVYHKLRSGFIGRVLHFRSPMGRITTVFLYKISRMIVGFN